MPEAKTVLKEFLGSFRDPDKASALFAEDGVFEMPFFVSLGLPNRFENRDSVKGLIATVLEYYPDFEFKDEDITVLIDTPDQVFAEYVAHSTAAATGRLAHHLFMGRLVAENGQITLLSEGLNTVAAASALLAGGGAGAAGAAVADEAGGLDEPAESVSGPGASCEADAGMDSSGRVRGHGLARPRTDRRFAGPGVAEVRGSGRSSRPAARWRLRRGQRPGRSAAAARPR